MGPTPFALAAELLVELSAHSHSESQFLPHLPKHSKSIMCPPHCGQTRLMIEEIMLAFASSGIVSMRLICNLLISLPASPGKFSELPRREAQPRCIERPRMTVNFPRVSVAFRRSVLVGWEFAWATGTGCRLARCMTLQAQCQGLTRECMVSAYRVSERFGKLLATDGLSRVRGGTRVLGDAHSGVKAVKIYWLSKS